MSSVRDTSRLSVRQFDAEDPDALAIVRMNRHTTDGAVDEYESFFELHGYKAKFNSVSLNPTDTQHLLPLTIDECTHLIKQNISNRCDGVACDHKLPTTQTGPMTTDVRTVAHACDLLSAANMDLPVHLVGMGFQNIGGILDPVSRVPGVHSHHQTRDKAVDFWWVPTGYVWMYGSYTHEPDTIRTTLLELDRDGFRREVMNSRGQVERIVTSPPYEACAFVIYEFNPWFLLDAIRQVPGPVKGRENVPLQSQLIRDLHETPSIDGDHRRRHVIRYAYCKDTLASLDKLRVLEPLIERIGHHSDPNFTDFTPEEIAELDRFQLRQRYRAVTIDGPPRTLPYGAYAISHISCFPFDRERVQECQQSDSAAISATVRRTNTGRSMPGSRVDPEKHERYDNIMALTTGMDSEKQKRYDSIMALTTGEGIRSREKR